MQTYAPSDDADRPKPYCAEEYQPSTALAFPYLNNVLIVGERGTGKELLAETIAASWKHHIPIKARFNCAGWSEQLARAEIFGYGKGVFTGQQREGKSGLIQDNPVVFLDEIQSLPHSVQASLLRLIEYGECQPLGSSPYLLKPKAHIIAAVQPAALVPSANFLPDLLDRFTIKISLPPLAACPNYIPRLLALLIYQEYKRRFRTHGSAFYHVGTEDNEEFYKSLRVDHYEVLQLISMRWPGNIRQLNNIVQCSTLRQCSYEDHTITPTKTHNHIAVLFKPHYSHYHEYMDAFNLDHDLAEYTAHRHVMETMFSTKELNKERLLSLLDLWHFPSFTKRIYYRSLSKVHRSHIRDMFIATNPLGIEGAPTEQQIESFFDTTYVGHKSPGLPLIHYKQYDAQQRIQPPPQKAPKPRQTLADKDDTEIAGVLKKHKGNITHAAAALKVRRETLQRALKNRSIKP